MVIGGVMTEKEYVQLGKSRMERKQRQGTSESAHQATVSGKKPHRTTSISEYKPDINDLLKYLRTEDVIRIKNLASAYEASYSEVPFSKDLYKAGSASGRSRREILDMLFTVVKQFTKFAQRLDSFSKIQQHDQEILLKAGVLELCFIQGAYVYDEILSRWPRAYKPMYRDFPTLYAKDIKNFVPPELFTEHMEFIRSIKELHIDEATTMLLLVIVLLSTDRPGLENEVLVAEEQEKFYILMKKYMSWRYGEDNTLVLYPKLLLRLPDLRELNDRYTAFFQEIQESRQIFPSLNIVSYFQRPSVIVGSSSSASRGPSNPMPSGTSHSDAGSHNPWNLRRNVLRAPSSTYSQEEESSSSESSGSMLPYRS